MFDCLIVGAGPAGATAAYHLGKQGHSVLLLEKESFPRYKPCGGGVSPAIAEWFDFDLSGAISNRISKVCYTWKMGDPVEVDLQAAEPMWMVRREIFDQFLVQQAQNQGIEFKANTEVTSVKMESDRVTVSTSAGDFHGRYLIAADGAKGAVAKALGFKERKSFSAAVLEIPTPADRPQDTASFDFGSLKNAILWSFPKVDGYSLSGGCLRGNKGNTQALQRCLQDYAQHLGLDSNAGTYYEFPMRLWSEHSPLHTSRALLAGEAAGVSDPLTAEGIRPAIFTGVQAAVAIKQSLLGDSEALPSYTQTIQEQWGSEMALAQRLAGVYHQFPGIAYKVGIKKPAAARIMSKILCGESRYADITEQAVKRIKKSLIPGKR